MSDPSRPGEGVEWTVGNKVLIRTPGSRYNPAKVKEGVITKAGRKWATVEEVEGKWPRPTQYSMETGFEKTDFIGNGRESIWVDQAAIDLADYRQRLTKRANAWKHSYHNSNWSLEDLEKLVELIDKNDPKKEA